jgi:hypothetical protein
MNEIKEKDAKINTMTVNNTVINNTVNNITINAFGKEDMSHITDKDYARILIVVVRAYQI